MKLYQVTEEYYKKIEEVDCHIPNSSGKKKKRPFVGPVIRKDEVWYLAPLSSPKKKHRYMKKQIDFILIEQGELGIINLNNMVPISKKEIKQIEFKAIRDKRYQRLLYKQWLWCKKNEKQIKKKAYLLYVLEGENLLGKELRKRCCSFHKLEQNLVGRENEKLQEDTIFYKYA